MCNPLVSIVIPLFNVELYLHECLNAIRSQTYKNFEVLLIDDGSTDGSSDICQKFIKKDFRFKYIFQRNQGVIAARKTGISLATGEYITFIDADDKVVKNFLELLISPFLAENIDIVVCGFYWWFPELKDDKREERASSPKKRLSSIQFAQSVLGIGKEKGFTVTGGYLWNKMFRTEAVKKINMPEVLGAEDELLLFKLLPQVSNIYYVDRPLYFYRQRRTSLVQEASFPFHLVQSRKVIMNQSDEPFKAVASLGFYRSVIYLIINILTGREVEKKHIFSTKKLSQEAFSRLRSPSLRHIISDEDKRYSFLLFYQHIPLIVLSFFIKFKIYHLTSFLVKVAKKIRDGI